MSDLELIDAVAHVTGQDAHEIRRRGFERKRYQQPNLEKLGAEAFLYCPY